MSFSLDTIFYASTRKRLLITKAENIAKRMKQMLKHDRFQLIEIQKKMKTQADKHRTDVEFKVDDKVWISFKNIQTSRSSHTLENKLFDSYKVVEKVETSYRLKLPISMKRTNSFHSSKLHRDPNDSLSGQHISSSNSVIIDEGDEWKLDDILASRRYRDSLQYKCKWHGFERNDEWYWVDSNNFKNAREIVEEFHKRYPQMARWEWLPELPWRVGTTLFERGG